MKTKNSQSSSKEILRKKKAKWHRLPDSLDFSDAAIARGIPSIYNSPRSFQSEIGLQKAYRPPYEDCRFVSSSSKDIEIDDETINYEAEKNISAIDYVDSADVDIVVKNGEVSIDGVVSNQRLKKYIESQVAKTTGVKTVKSRLRMRGEH